MLDYGPLRLTLAAVITVGLSSFLLEEAALGWHEYVPIELYMVAHGLVVAYTIRSAAAPDVPLLSLFAAYYLVAKAGPLLTGASMWIVPAFIGNPLDWAIYFACFVLIFKADHVYDLLHNNKAVNWVCVGLSYVSTVYSITGAVKLAAEHSLNDMHEVLRMADGSEESMTCSADWTVVHAVSWPVLMGTLSSVGAVFLLKFLRLDTGDWGPDIVRGVANTMAWAGVCIPAAVLYDMATNRYHEWWGCFAYRPNLVSHVEAETLVATWLLTNHCLEWVATHVLYPPETQTPSQSQSRAAAKSTKPSKAKAGGRSPRPAASPAASPAATRPKRAAAAAKTTSKAKSE